MKERIRPDAAMTYAAILVRLSDKRVKDHERRKLRARAWLLRVKLTDYELRRVRYELRRVRELTGIWYAPI